MSNLKMVTFADGTRLQLSELPLQRVRGWLKEGYHVVQFACRACGWSGTIQLGRFDYQQLLREGYSGECVRCGQTGPVELSKEITMPMLAGKP